MNGAEVVAALDQVARQVGEDGLPPVAHVDGFVVAEIILLAPGIAAMQDPVCQIEGPDILGRWLRVMQEAIDCALVAAAGLRVGVPTIGVAK
ncbi:hypothetical protein ACFQY5_14055 [Paeniroseomonas aquatica]|uniref:Uncharacterized protein n=1 Tax=Paeniroseomonas aquatica TaxID=373043 RepID=A0ABT8ACT8_9PROT|nr:hypothetical protein [Paeniroseomonas aquatica]MDN3567490.1 hypothetical protein [Paeniroseomonas aquatica]